MKSKNTLEYANEISGKNGMYDYLIDEADNVRVHKIVSLIGKEKKVLDVGCYDGAIGEKILNNNNVVYGIDSSERAIEIAIKKGIIAKTCNLESKFEFDDNYFDVVFAGEIIEHIFDTDFFMNEIWRVLKNGGELVLTTPNTASLGRRLMLLFGSNPYFEASPDLKEKAAGHIRFFIKDLLINFVNKKGFKVTNFESDIVNFPLFYSEYIAKVVPTLGKSLIIKAKKDVPQFKRL